jgi:transcriptional regulator with XRE-family HTH domain
MKKKIGKIIHNGRLKLGLSQLELAKRLGVNQSHVSKWENDESVPTGDDLIDIAVILDIVSELFPGYHKNNECITSNRQDDKGKTNFVTVDQFNNLRSELLEELRKAVAISTQVNNGNIIGQQHGNVRV